MNTFDEQKERAEQRGDEWMFGSISKDLANVPLQGRNVYLPAGVLQYNNIFDTKGCASRAPLNILEAKLDYFYENGMHPAIKKWCDDNGYRVDGKFALCDAYIEILSGTTKNGNSMKAPVDAIQNYGVIPAALLPLKDNMTWDEYMNPSRITKAHKDLGAEFLRRLTINYEKVLRDRFAEATSLDLIDVAVGAWSTPIDGIYPKSGIPINHAVTRFTNEIDIFDNYLPYMKTLAPDYEFFEWGYTLYITNQNPYPYETMKLFDVLSRYGLLKFFSEAYARLISMAIPEEPTKTTPEPQNATVQPSTAPRPTLTQLCTYMRDFEGKPGDLNYTNNNPLNCKFYDGGYLPQYLPVSKDKYGFAVFKDYQTGWLYGYNMIKNKILNHPEWTLYDLIENHAPSKDGNPVMSYASNVSKRLGVDVTFKVDGFNLI